MAALNPDERDALKLLRQGDMISREALDALVRKKLATLHPLELTEPGRIVCALLAEIDRLQRDDNPDARGSF